MPVFGKENVSISARCSTSGTGSTLPQYAAGNPRGKRRPGGSRRPASSAPRARGIAPERGAKKGTDTAGGDAERGLYARGRGPGRQEAERCQASSASSSFHCFALTPRVFSSATRKFARWLSAD